MKTLSITLGTFAGILYVLLSMLVRYLMGLPLFEEPTVTNWRDSLDTGYEKDCTPNDTPVSRSDWEMGPQ